MDEEGSMRRLFALLTCLATFGGLILYSQAGHAADNKPCNDNSGQCMISAATTYLDALVSHDATHIRLAPNARRTEQGVGFISEGADAIRQSLTPPTPNQFIIRLRDIRWFVDKPDRDAIAYLLVDFGSTIPPTAAAGTTHVAERFKVENGLITEIEAIYFLAPPCQGDGWSPNPGPPPLCLPLGG
jgi:hypothetical protein